MSVFPWSVVLGRWADRAFGKLGKLRPRNSSTPTHAGARASCARRALGQSATPRRGLLNLLDELPNGVALLSVKEEGEQLISKLHAAVASTRH